MKKEDFESLMKKYSCISEFEAPKLNPQISVTMKEYAVARDNHIMEVQKMASTALSVIGSLITTMYEGTDDLDFESFLTHMSDVGKMMTGIIHKQSNTRKAFIEPGLSKETKTVLKESKIDEFLFGKDLSEKIKEARALNKLGEDLKNQPAHKANAPKSNLNNRTPFVRRPTSTQMGYTPSGGRLKQKVFFKNRQQFINHRAPPPQQMKSTFRQEKKN